MESKAADKTSFAFFPLSLPAKLTKQLKEEQEEGGMKSEANRNRITAFF